MVNDISRWIRHACNTGLPSLCSRILREYWTEGGGRLDVLPYLLSWSLSLSPLPLSLSLLTLQHPLSPPIFHPLCFLLESDYRPRWSTTINDVSGEFVHVHSPLFPGVERRKRGGGGRRWKGSSVFRIRKAYSLHGAKL